MRTRLRAWREPLVEGVLPLMRWELRSYLRGARGPFMLLLSTGTVILLAGIGIPISFGLYDPSARAATVGQHFYGAFLSLEGLESCCIRPPAMSAGDVWGTGDEEVTER